MFILVVDDEADLCGLICLVLKKKHETKGVSSGEAAISQVAQRRPDLIFIDINMPGIGGIEAAAKIREIIPDVSIVFLSGDPIQVPHGERFVCKPFTPRDILSAL